MADGDSFAQFIRRIRAGDSQAARELLQQYEAAIRLEVRLRLRDFAPPTVIRFDGHLPVGPG